MISRWSTSPSKSLAARLRSMKRETIGIFRRLREIGVISRIGAVVRPNTIGASTLAALQVPPERLEEVAAIVSREPLVTHNYERTHALNLWFVIAGADATAIAGTIESIRQQTRLAAIDLPMLRAYHLGLGFPLGAVRPARREATGPRGYYHPIRAIAASWRLSRTACRWSSNPTARSPSNSISIRPKSSTGSTILPAPAS